MDNIVVASTRSKVATTVGFRLPVVVVSMKASMLMAESGNNKVIDAALDHKVHNVVLPMETCSGMRLALASNTMVLCTKVSGSRDNRGDLWCSLKYFFRMLI
jgi:hypothetical protein